MRFAEELRIILKIEKTSRERIEDVKTVLKESAAKGERCARLSFKKDGVAVGVANWLREEGLEVTFENENTFVAKF